MLHSDLVEALESAGSAEVAITTDVVERFGLHDAVIRRGSHFVVINRSRALELLRREQDTEETPRGYALSDDDDAA